MNRIQYNNRRGRYS